MKPADYESYSGSIDFLSAPQLSPEIEHFIGLVSQSLRRDAHLVDVGGGTGYILERILNQRLDLTATLIEPAVTMYRQAESRFTGRVKLISEPIASIIAELEPPGAFLFCRSLYALGDYHHLFTNLAKKLIAFGQLFILEPNTGPYNITAYRLELERRLAPSQHQEFQHHWPVIEAALQRFNEGLQNNEFKLFHPKDLRQLADESGFDRTFYRSPGIYGFRKRT